jgi:hypothetical protein
MNALLLGIVLAQGAAAPASGPLPDVVTRRLLNSEQPLKLADYAKDKVLVVQVSAGFC